MSSQFSPHRYRSRSTLCSSGFSIRLIARVDLFTCPCFFQPFPFQPADLSFHRYHIIRQIRLLASLSASRHLHWMETSDPSGASGSLPGSPAPSVHIPGIFSGTPFSCRFPSSPPESPPLMHFLCYYFQDFTVFIIGVFYVMFYNFD